MRLPPRGSSTCWPRRNAPTSPSCSRRSTPRTRASACARRRARTPLPSPPPSAVAGTREPPAARSTRRWPKRRHGSSPNPSVSSTAPMLGVVNLDKPVGPTSHDMVGLMRRLTGTRRIGHAGTLDPLASGVLPILVGAATRFSEELTGGRKRYEAVIRLGERSATDDAQGPLERVDAPLPSESAISAALGTLIGT